MPGLTNCSPPRHRHQHRPVLLPCPCLHRLEWDLGGWLGLSLRHLLFVLPAACMAMSQARLSPLGGSIARLVPAAAAVAAWGSLHPAALHSISGGMQPWIRLSVVEALAALLLAAGAANMAGWVVVGRTVSEW